MRRPPAAVALLALALAACTSGGTRFGPNDGPSSSPTGPSASATASPSGSAACPSAPALTSVPSGWPAPGSVLAASVLPYLVTAEIACGPNRLILTFLDPTTNQPVAKPERTASIALFDLARDPATPVATVEGTFLWGIVGERGVYVANVELPEAGTWGAAITTSLSGGPAETVRILFDVAATRSAKGVGDAAPAVRTPTLAEVGGDVKRISSDTKPRTAFYETSVDAALAAGRPFVLAFATPAFCTSAQCGPTLEVIKQVADGEPGILVINVEPYRLRWTEGRLQPELGPDGALQVTDATAAYGILTEPWVYVVDRDGIIRASLEGVLGAEELRAAIAAVR